MKWFFALSADTLASGEHDWPGLISCAVRSARQNTSLSPHLIWDGPEHELLDELRAQGVRIIFHRVPFYEDLKAFNPSPHYLPVASGCFLRVEIAQLETQDEFVLYTDADVIFLDDPVPMLRALRPRFLACAPEFEFDDNLNSGVQLINVPAMRADYPAFVGFIRSNLHLGLDQDMYRHFYRDKYEKLVPALNWKPYWGQSKQAVILHWHGIKPVAVRRLLADPEASYVPSLLLLLNRNRPAYQHYLDEAAAVMTRPLPVKCAAVLVVKNEAHDIAAWLAWYHVLGFDSFIVYDDDSDDGTWEILTTAAAHLDIRLARTIGDRAAHHQLRQTLCYQRAIASHRDEFAWLAFFDSDEFLFLSTAVDIKTFLASFEHADQVCINWCNYGSSGHYLKPDAPAFEAYTWHGGSHRSVNRHVKSIVRPGAIGPHWINVHCFDVKPERAVLANGAVVEWSDIKGIIATDPDWSAAKLMHYQCRSMEHFIERLKKLPQFRGIPRLWDAYDMRDMEDLRPQNLAPAARAAMARLTGEAPAQQSGLIFDIGMSDGNDTAFYLAKGFKVAGVEADVEMFFRLQDRFADEISSGDLTIYNLAAADSYGAIVEFFHHSQAQSISGLARDHAEFQPGNYKSYHVMTIDWATLAAKHGVPYYLKIDIEGQEVPFLRGLAASTGRPAFVSAECDQFAPVQALYDLGYRRFKLVDQQPPGGLKLPAIQHEGRALENWQFTHASGPFGRDLPGEWVDFPTITTQWHAAAKRFHETWFDCHAAL